MRVTTDTISGSDPAHTAITGGLSLFDTRSILLPLLRVYSQYFGFSTFLLPERRVFRDAILQVLSVPAVIWEDTASIGNILGLICTADILLPLWEVLLFGRY